jgi:hypothetical protein
MADRRSLQWIGICYGGVTAAVMLVASLVVADHVAGRLSLDAARPPLERATQVR